MAFITKNKRAIGERYERLAQEYLERQGYRVIEQNVTYRGGEIDLVCERVSGITRILVIIEVRMRAAGSVLHPEEALIGIKSIRFLRAAKVYLSRYRGQASEVRLDLISFKGEVLHHFQDFLRL